MSNGKRQQTLGAACKQVKESLRECVGDPVTL